VTLPERLTAPAAGWTTYADVVVVGSGIAGLTAALQLREVGSVMVVTKDVLTAGSTGWAQGGIAAAVGPGDSPDQHLHDTLVAGAGLCDEQAVRVLVGEGPAAVRDLIALGARFDQTASGALSAIAGTGSRTPAVTPPARRSSGRWWPRSAPHRRSGSPSTRSSST
jgi:L-aspartate oxidase